MISSRLVRVNTISNLKLVKDDNRRIDNYTRQTIDELQGCFYDAESVEQALSRTLKYLVGVTLCDHAVCFVSGDETNKCIDQGSQLKKLVATSNDVDYFDTDNLSKWLAKGQLLHPVYFNAPLPDSWHRLFVDNEMSLSLMMVPLFVHLKLRGVFLLVKKNNQFSPYMLTRIKPVIASTSCAIYSSESVDSDYGGLNQELFGKHFVNSLIASSPCGIIVIDENNLIVNSNPVAQDMFYHVNAKLADDYNCPLSDHDIHQFIPGYDDLFKWSKQPDKEGDSKKSIIPNVWHRIKGLSIFEESLLLNLTVFRFKKGTKRFSILQILNITDYEKSANDYREASKQLQALTYLVPVGIIQVDTQWNCFLTNEKWSEFTSLTEDKSHGRGWINAIHANDVHDTLTLLHQCLSNGEDLNKEIRLVNTTGSVTWVDFSIRVLFDNDNQINGFIGAFSDVTDRYVNREKLRIAAEYDALTGLTNRAKLQQQLEKALQQSARDNSLVSVMFLDLDGFKDVNDTLGHDAGDLILQKVAQRLINVLRKTDTVARFGGDEFVILLGKDENPTDVTNVAEKIIACVSESYNIKEHSVYLTTSVGIAQGLGKEIKCNELLKFADSALYRAKQGGKNKVEVFSPIFDEENRKRVMLQNELRNGLSENRFSMVYQPICDCNTGEITSVEALLRFTTSVGDNVSPDNFIPLLEETNLIINVGQWIVDHVCSQVRNLQLTSNFPKDAYATINVSAKELLHPDFASFIKQCISTHNLKAQNIVIEITESVFIKKQEVVRSILQELQEFGIRIALDDFGTGYSSLSYLQKFPIDIIKVDRSFIDDLSENSNDSKITKSIIALAKSLDLKTVAEGVETEFSLAAVQKMNADMVQGYFLAKPMPLESLKAFIDQTKSSN